MATTLSFQPPRGMRDFYPEDMQRRNVVFNAWRQAAARSGFCEYDACVVESLDLLRRKAGEEILEQIYHFQDKSGRDLALRPEMTPTLARMIVARQGALQFPLKWFTIAQCFRYERTTRGRKREHYQWNLDILGEPGVAAEAEVLATAASAMRSLGLDQRHYRIRYNSRLLLSELLEKLGISSAHHASTFLALDKRGKIEDSDIEKLLVAEGVASSVIPSVFKLLEINSLEQAFAVLGERSPAQTEIETFIAMLGAYGIADLATFDIGVIRGLSYYTGIVFEAFDTSSGLRAIFGGGRYGKLLASIGGGDISGVGLGFGDVVIAELLADLGLDQAANGATVDYTIGFMHPEQQLTGVQLAAALRQQAKQVSLSLAPEKPKSFFAKASSGARYAIYLGPDDLATGTIKIKTLADRSQRDVAISDILQGADHRSADL
ncbi:MAG TPA: histidine--tRNA ligase [Verrucomicrobia bacterium]|nr:histidine--tRNA ligase [Verrucomicrobiota bacterium]